jgi:multiple sugar transport system permease protein
VATTTAPAASTNARGTAWVPAHKRGSGRVARDEGVAGYVFLTPFLIGLMTVTAIPMLYSLYLSFTNYDILSTSDWVGLKNYRDMFTADPQFLHAVKVTVTYAVVAVPAKLGAALGVALLLNRSRRGVSLFRGLFYLPSLLGGSVGLAIIWQAMFSRNGSFNALLAMVGIHGKPWVNDPSYSLGTLILLGMWQFGAPMVIFLAGLKQIPVELYEAASVDGASTFRKFMNVTLPVLSPVIFFNLVLETIHAFQIFTGAIILSNGTGGPADSLLAYSLNLYLTAFRDYRMGYASAMAWVFLVVIGVVTAVLFRTGRMWVHYSDGGDER